MPKFDHHVHTSKHSPDSLIEPAELVEQARLAGLDGVVITDHDYQWEPGELADLNRVANGLVVLSGVEVSALEGHFLVYGLSDLRGIEPGIELASLLRIVETRGAAIVAAHPYRWGQDFDAILDDHGAAFHALELVSNNITPDTRELTRRALALHGLRGTGSSDGHEPEVVGCYFTEFDRPIRTILDFVEALRRGEGRPGYRPGARLSSGPVES